MNLLEQAMQPEVLDQAWNLLKREHTPWSATVSREDMQRNSIRHILDCRDEVLNGKYQPEPIRQFTLPKPDGRQRLISAQHLKDKLVQRALLIIIEPKAEAIFHHDSYAYRRRRGVQMAMRKVRERIKIGKYWLVDADIKRFFDNIPLSLLRRKLKSFLNDREAMKLFEKWLKQGVHSSSFLGSSKGISQGAVLSPLLCNLYMTDFDQAMSDAHIPFVRFADDFLLFAEEKSQANQALKYAEKTLSDLELELNKDKTRVIKSSKKVIFLGQSLPNVRTPK